MTKKEKEMLQSVARGGSARVCGVRSLISLRSYQSQYGAWIGGSEYNPPGAPKYVVEDPARRVPLCEVLDAGSDTVNLAVENAREAFDKGSWSRMDVRDRADILNEGARALRKRVPEFAEVRITLPQKNSIIIGMEACKKF